MCSTWSHSGLNALGRLTCWTAQLWIAANQRLCVLLMNKVAAKQTVSVCTWCTAPRIPETLLEAFKCRVSLNFVIMGTLLKSVTAQSDFLVMKRVVMVEVAR